MIGCPSSCDFLPWIQCIRWPGPYDPQDRFRDIAVLPKGRASAAGGALADTRLVSAASSSEPPTSVGLACRPVGAWRRQLVKRIQSTRRYLHAVGTNNSLGRG